MPKRKSLTGVSMRKAEALRKRLRRQNETQEETIRRLREMAIRDQAKRDAETEAETIARRKAIAKRARDRRRAETENEAIERRRAVAKRARERRRVETEDKTIERRRTMAKCAQDRRNVEREVGKLRELATSMQNQFTHRQGWMTPLINMNHIRKDAGLMQLVWSEPGLSVKKEIVEDDWQAAEMEHRTAKHIEEQSPMEMTMKTEAEETEEMLGEGAPSTSHIVCEIEVNYTKEEIVLGELLNSEPALLLEEEILKDSRQGSHAHHYTCDHCEKSFRKKQALQQHIEGVHGEHIHRCQKCNKTLKCRKFLQLHKTNIHSKPQHDCEVCHRLFKTSYLLRAHFKKAHGLDDFQSKSDLRPQEVHNVSPIPGERSAVVDIGSQHGVDAVKSEPADGALELGPVVFQHMDANYRPL